MIKRIEKPLRFVDAAIDKVLRSIYEYGPPKPERPTASTVIYHAHGVTIMARELAENIVELSAELKPRSRFADMTPEESEAVINDPNEWRSTPSMPEAMKRERIARAIVDETNWYREISSKYEQIVRALETEISQLPATIPPVSIPFPEGPYFHAESSEIIHTYPNGATLQRLPNGQTFIMQLVEPPANDAPDELLFKGTESNLRKLVDDLNSRAGREVYRLLSTEHGATYIRFGLGGMVEYGPAKRVAEFGEAVTRDNPGGGLVLRVTYDGEPTEGTMQLWEQLRDAARRDGWAPETTPYTMPANEEPTPVQWSDLTPAYLNGQPRPGWRMSVSTPKAASAYLGPNGETERRDPPQSFAVSPTSGAAARGMTEERRKRAEAFRRIKDTTPTLSYVQVAMRANSEGYSEATEDDVRNDYRAMGWEWQRADKVR